MGFVRKVGRAIDDAIIQPVVNTVEKIVENPEALLAVGALAVGVPAIGGLLGGGAATAAAAGAGMTATELAALDLALGGAGGSLGAAELGAALAGGVGGASGGAGLLESVFDPTFGGELPAVIGGGAESVFDPTFGGTLSDVSTGAIPTASLADKAVTAAKGLGVSDALRAAGLVGALAGAGSAIGSGDSGGGYPIVPIPSDWTSPIKPTGVAEFTPLAPIDFGNKEMLQGTQWEKLLSPTYNAAPAMPNPAVSTNPSNMSFDQLMGVLGNTRTSVPTQNLSINDVIAGIQSQYGQAPKGSMG
jgi:hypothetical protein